LISSGRTLQSNNRTSGTGTATKTIDTAGSINNNIIEEEESEGYYVEDPKENNRTSFANLR
jgi:hypothetical protein